MMQVTINKQEIPQDTLRAVTWVSVGVAFVQGEAVDKKDRTLIGKILDPLKDNDTVQFDLQSSNNAKLFGVGCIRGIRKTEQPAGDYVQLRYSFTIQLAQ